MESEQGKVSAVFSEFRNNYSIDSDAEAYTSEDEDDRETDAVETLGGWFVTQLQGQHLQPGMFFDINTSNGISCIGMLIRSCEEEGDPDSYILRDVDFNMETQEYDEFRCKLDEIRPLSKDGQRYFRKLEYEECSDYNSVNSEGEYVSEEEEDIVDLAALMRKAELAREEIAALVGNIKFDACQKEQQQTVTSNVDTQRSSMNSGVNNDDAKETQDVKHEKRPFDQ
eukprot:CAMPEP_0204876508 /NCGR_PEP_ID=MMETSP1348-20121228/47678_1 /ASSEMBLY_ACC=CAM_ASM_000700 /TAXON_ID=215587 /ORGANISM="Aplanochytrium stocchinoi, Strain GSBS06" /LENGTH=225 /DNA_ID=CAMNT_0052033283 /DNA_START=476 /DNA_END=1153 /DNA_ORIENTATION=+